MIIGILDCDQHFEGDGTAENPPALALTAAGFGTFRKNTGARTMPNHLSTGCRKVVQGFAGCDLLIYQAGLTRTSGPMGGFLTTKELAERDRNVFLLQGSIQRSAMV
jgi:hypothetical protein